MTAPATQPTVPIEKSWFATARYGMFIHYGLYSLLGRGEWILNREQIPVAEYKKLANDFTAKNFDADAIADLAVRNGMKYLCFTTMHHDGFCLYDTKLTDFSTTKTAAKRDLTAEVIEAARRRGLKIALYHSLNNWTVQPDAVDALENKAAYDTFIANTFARIEELVRRYNPIDVLWYDGWWPFHHLGWQAEKMNAMVRAIQPHIYINGRNGLPGDFATPEQHMSAPNPWRPWEACLTLNDSWGYHAGDDNWKSPLQLAMLLITAAQGRGNLLMNIGPHGDGTVPAKTVEILDTVGSWLKRGGHEALWDTDRFTINFEERRTPQSVHRGDWNHVGSMTAKGNSLYWIIRKYPGTTATLGGLQAKARRVTLLGDKPLDLKFTQEPTRLIITGLPADRPDPLCPIIRIDCDRAPEVYLTGGLRVPNVPHPHYDPCPSDLPHTG